MEEALHVGDIAAAGRVAVGRVLGWWRGGRAGQEGIRVQSGLNRGGLQC